MDIFKSNKGVNKISFRGYSYRKNTTNISTQCWRCDIKTCPGTATTDINYTLDGVIPVEKRHHNHPPDLARTELLVAIDKMVESAVTVQDPPRQMISILLQI
ncbi:unnamed protein product [Lepeophtheirus salmonis]|uniref:(salmon louse) hypothetical protein n=1 Tax=Lepeophtheirus salmonis TaxID=72036 RepID=A0A7R8H709_LEPSM|nr:unnamed protein product [Lepeophtheirus salmonis]CAF2911169.1 unnamed protein product [Lepeophtheirus salmonis]